MPEGESSFPHPDTSPVHLSEAHAEQSVQALVDKYIGVSGEYYKGRWSLSKERGIVEGRYGTLERLLAMLGQKDVAKKLDYQAFHGEPAEPLALAPITRPANLRLMDFLADYQHQYMLKLLSEDSRPRIGIVDRITGRAEEINAYFDYASGINEGRLAEMKSFLHTIGLGVQTDSIQQHADQMVQRDPKRMREQVDQQIVRGTDATVAKFHEAAQELKEGVREFDKIVSQDSPKQPE